jgi:MFS family permease
MFAAAVGVFELGNSSEAFLVLRAQNCGLSLPGILGMVLTFNVVYSIVSTPGGVLSDRIGRRGIIVGGWLAYGLIYLGLGAASAGWHVWALYGAYGVYMGLTYGTAKAFVADLVPQELRGTAYGIFNAVLAAMSLPASVIAGILWQGVGTWKGLGPGAPFRFGAVTALAAAAIMLLWGPRDNPSPLTSCAADR